VGNLQGSTRAATFQRSADPAAYAQRVREQAGQPMKKRSEGALAAAYRVRIADVTEYALILDRRTNFLLKGIRVAERDFITGLENELIDELAYRLGGR
jgi:hypothetical protein